MKKIFLLLFFLIFNISFGQKSAHIDSIKAHLTYITKTKSYRNYANIAQLNKTALYIKSNFEKATQEVAFQEFKVDGNVYKNVIASFGIKNKTRIIIGAHYDVCGNQEGADDNASGIVGLLELARLLKTKKLKYRIDLVAYTLEEPPYFRTEKMGSYIHAKSLLDNNVNVYGMVSLEMIGYFTNAHNSQQYPDPRLGAVYGNQGNFITLVNQNNKKKFASDFGNVFLKTTAIKTVVFDSPPSQPAVDFSDHLNYWNLGFSALMITDTAFLRNKNYHTKADTLETLDLPSMKKVIDGVFKTLIKL
ncbi:M28 family peptidase [uncultured Algibacter sp.]|uniref:M28 family peptidase n=1 Tax=uncultured Algibacter sp. TaxID=298659 RepID=UPI003217C9D9